MRIITKASKSMFEDRFDVREGPNLKMQLKILESKSTLVRNCTHYMGATFESKKFNLFLETVLKIWSCSTLYFIGEKSRRRPCLNNEFALALLRFYMISCIQSSWPNSSATG